MKLSRQACLLGIGLVFTVVSGLAQSSFKNTRSKRIYGELIELENDYQEGESREEVFVVPHSQPESSILEEMDLMDINATTEMPTAPTEDSSKTSSEFDEDFFSELENENDNFIESLETNSSDSSELSSGESNSKTKTVSALANTLSIDEELSSPWSFGFLYWGSANMAKVHERTATIVGLYGLTVAYLFENQIKATVTPVFFMNYNLEQGNTKHKVGNAVLGLHKVKAAQFFGNNLSLSGQVYLPTSYEARNAGLNGIFRGDATLSRKLTSVLSGHYMFSPRYYWQSNRSSASFDEFGRLEENAKANTGFRLLNELGGGYKINNHFSLGATIAIDHFVNYEDPNLFNDGVNRTTFDWSFKGILLLMKNLSLTAMISQSHDVASGGYAFLNGEESKYSGIVSASF